MVPAHRFIIKSYHYKTLLYVLGSKVSLRADPKILKHKTTDKIQNPGNTTSHQESVIKSRPSLIMVPHSGRGGLAPKPKNPKAAIFKIPSLKPKIRLHNQRPGNIRKNMFKDQTKGTGAQNF